MTALPTLDRDALATTLVRARGALLAELSPAGHWRGELSGSGLSTATAVAALAIVDGAAHDGTIRRGIEWLATHRNADDGWGDTPASASNISTTTLVWAAFGAAGERASAHAAVATQAEAWLAREAGGTAPDQLVAAITQVYGADRTFSVPILTMCTLCGRLGTGVEAWRRVRPLPFELAALPHRWFKWLRLPVVSYALPALIAIGQARHRHAPSRNPLARLVRRLTQRRTLDVLAAIQPDSGGFLEASPLTSFVAMSLASCGERGHPAVTRGIEFLLRTVRADGSWAIDVDLATWVTTLCVNALAAAPGFRERLPAEAILDWLLAQQHTREHPYTHAAPGGWAWTDLSGGVPDADDTPGALLALRHLAPDDPRVRAAAADGVRWLLGLQNRDGGMPTFCRGWGTLPFDRSAADLTAHTLLALEAWAGDLPATLQARVAVARDRALGFLAGAQRADGAWVPLWFGNEAAPNHENPLYGTARVLIALAELSGRVPDAVPPLVERGVAWLLRAQGSDGGWGGARGVLPSIEETALGVHALAALLSRDVMRGQGERLAEAASAGAAWLIGHTEGGTVFPAAPIGFYFASLWYSERLYPVAFTVAALELLSCAMCHTSP